MTYVSCQRCGSPTCADCQRPAPVGVQCVGCVKAEAKANPRAVRRPSDGRPVVTYVIAGVCAVLWLGQLVSSEVTSRMLFAPALGQSEPWRFLTAAFVHSPSSPIHLAFNMFALFITGQYLEPILGRLKFVALFAITAVGGSVGFMLLALVPALGQWNWYQATVGASGAVFGLFMAVVIVNMKLKRDISQMLVIIGINLVLGFVISGIAWQAHLGGLATGALCAAALTRTRDSGKQWIGLAGVSVLVIAVAVLCLAAGPAQVTG